MDGTTLSIFLLIPAGMIITILLVFGIIVPRGVREINHEHYRARIENDEMRESMGLKPLWTDAEKEAWKVEMGE